MATIAELEQKIDRLERQILEEIGKTEQMIEKSDKALDFATHAYKVDHYGIIWVWDTEQQGYRKTKMRVMTPEIADKAVESRHIADNAIEGHHIQDDTIEGRMIKNKTIDGRSLKDDIIGPELIEDNSINGDSYQADAFKPGKLADDAVQTRNIKDCNVTRKKLSQEIQDELENLQNQITSLVAGSSVPISTQFGDSNLLVVSQKTLTEAFNRVWGKLEEITGESLKGFNLIVTPEYYIGEDGCTVHISASSADTVGKFESIKFYINNILAIEEYDVESLEYTTTVNETCEIKCVAKILGIEYTETKMLTHYSSFFLGASTSYTNIMNVSHVISINDHMRGSYNVPCNDGDRIFVVVGKSLREGFVRADMNGVEIPFTETEVTVGGVQYVVFASVNTYQQGTYNIDINS